MGSTISSGIVILCSWDLLSDLLCHESYILDVTTAELHYTVPGSIDIFHGQPPQFVDPRTQTTYVLIRVEEYELLQEILAEEKVQRAIHRTALRNAVAHLDEEIL